MGPKRVSSRQVDCLLVGNRYYLTSLSSYIYSKYSVPEFLEHADHDNEDDISHYYDIKVVDNNTLLVREERESHKDFSKSKLPFGTYILGFDFSKGAIYTTPVSEIFSDQYLDLHNKVSMKIEKNLAKFISLRKRYKMLNLVHKRGYLLYGPPGNGKTMLIKHIVQKYRESSYIFYIQDRIEWKILAQLRDMFRDADIFFIIEELTKQTGSEEIHELLEFLDGTFSWNHCAIFATTNYPEMLPANICNRPSRFDMVLQFGVPSDDVRKVYIEHFLGSCPKNLLRLSQGHSIAFLKELCLLSLVYDDNEEVRDSVKNVEIFNEYINNNNNNNKERYNKSYT